MAKTLFGIFHTAYERAGDYFYEAVNSDFINTFIVESHYESEEFAKSMNEIVRHPDKKVWIAVTYLGFKSINNATIADNGETQSTFNPQTQFFADYKKRIDKFIAFIKKQGWYDSVLGFYMDEPMLWNITNDDLQSFTGYFRTQVAPDKRFFVCFSIAGVAPEFWTVNDVKPITPASSQYLTDIAFDMYHKWSDDYEKILELMLMRAGNRDDLRVWMIPCTMNYRGDKNEEYCIEHLNQCYRVLKGLKQKGGLMCFTYYTFAPEEEALGNIGLDKLTDSEYKDYWPNLYQRIIQIGKEITSGKLD
ncbi:MAG: hypothetical protein IJW13_00430 [Clostridia bacterium]|nr:hypothetical protein [Clostridia bacterium]